ncbi:DUF4405 domain-containing protein [Oxalobacteraceae bacterium OM1]|nr:DUF4405 domain-containing protein [Oxalobacteraceae bacterium OM1]
MTKRHTDPRRHVNLRLERWHRRSVYVALGWLFATGVLFLVPHYFMRIVTQFGEAPHPLEPFSMKLHGGGAMVGLFFLGTLLNGHIRRAVKSGRNLVTGWSMIAVLLALIASGYGLYYIAGESDRGTWSLVHWIVGLAAGALFVAHLIVGRRSRPGPLPKA